MRPREFTPEEANAALPRVREILPPLREALHERDFAAEQVEDLRRMHGDALADPREPAHGEHAELLARAAEADATVRALTLELQQLGAELKDPVLGLVDFYGRVDGELVYLCWKEGEEAVEHWHPLVGGFSARRPL